MMRAPYSKYKASGVPWLGQVPAHWKVDRLKWSTEAPINGIWGTDSDGIDDIACIRVADFDRNSFATSTNSLTLRAIPNSDRKWRLLRKHDLLLEKSGGGDKQLVGAVVEFDQDMPAVTSNFVAKMTCREGMHPRYWVYVHAHLYSGRVNLPAIKQTTGIQNLDAPAYFDEQVTYPPFDEQVSISRFLDCETKRIDALVAKKRRLLELLDEKRLAVITHAVTKGLDPAAPMKDSGIDGLGQIPGHWHVCRVKFVTVFITSGSRGWAEYYSDEGATFLQSGNIGREMNLDFQVHQRVLPPLGAEGTRTQVRNGDVLVCITGARTGAVGHVSQDLGEAYINLITHYPQQASAGGRASVGCGPRPIRDAG